MASILEWGPEYMFKKARPQPKCNVINSILINLLFSEKKPIAENVERIGYIGKKYRILCAN